MIGSAMPLFRRSAFAFVLSLALGGMLQQVIMLARNEYETVYSPIILAGIIAVVTLVFTLVARNDRSTARMSRTAIVILAVMLALGLIIFAIGLALLQPGFAGDILYRMALFVDFQLLLPAVVAVPVHWLRLRAVVSKPIVE
jgi:uncharacterized membrane protein